MNIRKRGLPMGWYPNQEREIQNLVETWKNEKQSEDGPALGGVAPHAGWFFCGRLIARVVMALDEQADTVVVTGGHAPPGSPLIVYPEELWQTPCGLLERDKELGEWMDRHIQAVPERGADNTVEVMMPILAAMRGGIRWLAWRVPADQRALELGRLLARGAETLGRRIVVLASTDLTHYGPNYGFTPSDSLADPLGWAKRRDRRFLDALAGMREEEVLELAEKERSACSAGGTAAALAFAKAKGARKGRILEYITSHEVHPDASFVGYGALTWPRD